MLIIDLNSCAPYLPPIQWPMPLYVVYSHSYPTSSIITLNIGFKLHVSFHLKAANQLIHGRKVKIFEKMRLCFNTNTYKLSIMPN